MLDDEALAIILDSLTRVELQMSALKASVDDLLDRQDQKKARKPKQTTIVDDGYTDGVKTSSLEEMKMSWNAMCERHPGPKPFRDWTSQRIKHLRARCEGKFLGISWFEMIQLVEASPFLTRQCAEKGAWRPDIDWILTESAWTKLHEGKYSARDGVEATVEGEREHVQEEEKRPYAARPAHMRAATRATSRNGG